jgi:hypothetical protein
MGGDRHLTHGEGFRHRGCTASLTRTFVVISNNAIRP